MSADWVAACMHIHEFETDLLTLITRAADAVDQCPRQTNEATFPSTIVATVNRISMLAICATAVNILAAHSSLIPHVGS